MSAAVLFAVYFIALFVGFSQRSVAERSKEKTNMASTSVSSICCTCLCGRQHLRHYILNDLLKVIIVDLLL